MEHNDTAVAHTVHLRVMGMMCQKSCGMSSPAIPKEMCFFPLNSNLTDLTIVTFHLLNTHTSGSTVENALKRLEGCTYAKASFPDSYATVTCTGYSISKLEAEAIHAVDCVGFDATVLTEKPAPMATIHIKVTGMMCQKSCGTLILHLD